MATGPINPTQPPGIPAPPQTIVINNGVIPWNVETIPLPAAGATSAVYTLLKTPQLGAILLWCWDDGTSGFLLFTTNPITFDLPVGWNSTNTLQIAYQG